MEKIPGYREKMSEERVINGEELNSIYCLEVAEDERDFFKSMKRDERFFAILNSLATRNIKNELPISESTFRYRRNLKECERLRISVYKLLNRERNISQSKKNLSKRGDLVPDQNLFTAVELPQLLEDAATLLALEKRKASWLEKNYYPSLYERTVRAAKGEVNQFLIRQKNTDVGLDNFTDNNGIQINLQDELTYLIDNNSIDSTGGYYPETNEIKIRIPNYFSKQDEWRIFLVLVHELLHHASYQNDRRIGIKDENESPDRDEINEAAIEIITFLIAKSHLDKQKTSLGGESENLGLADMAYYTFTSKIIDISSKIPLSSFIDALFNEEGLSRLSKKFDEAFGEGSLISFAEYLKELRAPTPKKGPRG